MLFYSCTGERFFFLSVGHSVLGKSKREYYRLTCSKFSPLKICSSQPNLSDQAVRGTSQSGTDSSCRTFSVDQSAVKSCTGTQWPPLFPGLHGRQRPPAIINTQTPGWKKQIILMTLLCFVTRQTPILIFRRVCSETNEPHCAGKLGRWQVQKANQKLEN